jgi:hypothetical protein
MVKSKLILSLASASVALTVGAAAVSKDASERFNALNNLGIAFSSAALALVTNEKQNRTDDDIK